MIIQMPDGTKLDLGDNPDPEVKAAAAKKYQEQEAAMASKPLPSSVTPVSGGAPTDTTKREPWAPILERAGAPIVGGALGTGAALLAGQPELVPYAAAAGAGLFATGADVKAQRQEIEAGVRTDYNPARTVMEGLTNAAFAGMPLGDTILQAVARTGTLGTVSNMGINLMEGKGIGSPAENAIAFLTAGGLGAMGKYSQIRDMSVKEVGVVPEISDHINVMTKPGGAPTHGPDGEPTLVPRVQLLDQFGKPISDQTIPYPEPYTTPKQREQMMRQTELDALTARRRPNIQEAEPVKRPTPLGKPMEPLLEPDGGINTLLEQAHDSSGIPGDKTDLGKISDLTKEWTKYAGHNKDYMARLEDETGLPLYTDYDALSAANKKWKAVQQSISGDAWKVLKGTDSGQQLELIQGLMTDDTSMLPKAVRAKVDALNKITDRSLSTYGITSKDFWGDIVPALAEGNTDVLADPKYSKLEVGRAASIMQAIDEGRLRTSDPNLGNMMGRLIKTGTFDDIVGPLATTIKNKYNGNAGIPPAVTEAFNHMIGAMDGVPDQLSKSIGAAVSHTFDQMGFQVDGRTWANRMVNAAYGSMLGAKVGPLIRISMHNLQTGLGTLGPRWTAAGYAQMLTPEGRAAVESSGVIADGIMHQLSTMGDSNTGKFLDRTVSASLAPFGLIKNMTRGSMYLGARARVLNAAAIAGEDLGKFMRLSGAIGMSKQDAGIIRGLWQQGDIAGAADRAGMIVADHTTPFHDPVEAPRILTGSIGKYMAPLASWSNTYRRYIASLFERGGGATPFDVAKRISWWLTGNSAVAGTMYGLGKYFGDPNAGMHALGFTFIGPAIYMGSPIYEALHKGAQGMKALSEVQFLGGSSKKGSWGHPPPSEMAQAVSAFTRSGMLTFVPLSGIIMDAKRASEEATPRERIGRLTGFRTGAVRTKGFSSWAR